MAPSPSHYSHARIGCCGAMFPPTIQPPPRAHQNSGYSTAFCFLHTVSTGGILTKSVTRRIGREAKLAELPPQSMLPARKRLVVVRVGSHGPSTSSAQCSVTTTLFSFTFFSAAKYSCLRVDTRVFGCRWARCWRGALSAQRRSQVVLQRGHY